MPTSGTVGAVSGVISLVLITAVVVLGIAAAFYYKRRRPAKFETAGRLINEGL